MRARRILRVRPPAPLGEVTFAPAALTGRSEADLARALTAPRRTAEAADAAALPRPPRQAYPATLGTMLGRTRRFG